MTDVKVIDASALAALVFAEPDADRVVDRIGSATLAAPTLLRYEIASVCLKKIRANPGSRELLLGALQQATRLSIADTQIDHTAVIGLADECGLTTYDASYLWLARELGAGLVTLDETLARAATVVLP